MDTLTRIRNTMKSFEGRIKALENDNSISLEDYCDRCSSLEHEFYNSVKRILEQDEDEKANVSSVQIARHFGLIDKKG